MMLKTLIIKTKLVTTWKFMGLAHDKDVNFGLIESETVARKTVMVQPNMPRFVRVGDRASIAARIFNTSEKSAEGTAVMQLVDPETDKTVFEQKKSFKVAAGQTTAVSFEYCPDANSSMLCARYLQTDATSATASSTIFRYWQTRNL